MSKELRVSDKPPATRAMRAKRPLHKVMGKPTTEEDPTIGKIFSTTESRRYQIVDDIDRGGMGIVYLAEGLHDNKKVAIKVLHTKFTGDQKKQIEERFLREAEALMTVHHTHAAEIIDIPTYQGAPFLVMEYLQGHELEKALKKSRIDWNVAKPILLQVCDALQAAHDKKLIHRDLKPSNIYLIKKEGGGLMVKVIDFGLAKFGGDQSDSLTRTGFFMGTVGYASPEQASGKRDYDHRIDIYALGVIMYRILCGKLPFRGETDLETLNMHINNRPVPPSKRNPEANIPPAIERMVLKALEKNPGERFQDMLEMRKAIENDGIGDVDQMMLERAVKEPSSSVGYVAEQSQFTKKDFSFTFDDEEPYSPAPIKKSDGIGKWIVSAVAAIVIGAGIYLGIGKTPSGMTQPTNGNDRVTVETGEEQKNVPYTITIGTKPSGAQVYVEQNLGGRKVQRPLGKTPFTKIMPPGNHTIIVKRWRKKAVVEVSPENNIHNVVLR